ncbi:Uma2 family endonuclease [Actinoplanes sp. NPDC051411]|uniref:Uma2 family endonuclease n=1 Tax=Actinoplanes sp. NPDC051411 TaxID=3155522 RepID=UPI00343D25C6
MSGDPIEEESMTAVMLPVDPALLERDDLTVDDLVDLPEDLRYELIDGRLVLTPRALTIHNFIGRQTANAIDEFSPEEFVSDNEQAVLVNLRNEFVPDVMILRAEGANRSPVLPSDVLLVVEVVSKSSESTDRSDKAGSYASLGIPHYWIIDPLRERVTLSELRLDTGGYRQVLETDQLVTLDEPWKVTLDLPAWTRKRDRLRAAASADV